MANDTGRPSLYSFELQQQICQKVREGDPPHVAARVCGIGQSTHYDWMAQGARGIEPGVTYRNAIARAEAEFQSEARRQVLTGDEKGVSFGPSKAHLELLSRRFPKDWAPRVKHEIVESQNLFFEALSRVCSSPETFQRVSEAKDCSLVFELVCEELARLDGQREAGGASGEEARDEGGESGSVVH